MLGGGAFVRSLSYFYQRNAQALLWAPGTMLARPHYSYHSTDFCLVTGSHYVALAGLKLTYVDQAGLKLTDLRPSASTSQAPGLKACATTPGRTQMDHGSFLLTFSTGFRLYIDFITSLLK